jgi:uncharacterized protein YdaU (DUF1376 family)
MSRAFDEFPLSISDYLADTQHLSTVQHGAYLLILMTLRRAGGWLDDDDGKLARIVKMTLSNWKKVSPEIRSLLIFQDGKLSQKRVLSDIQKQQNVGFRNAINGKLGGIAKSLKTKNPDMATANFSPEVRQNGIDSALTLIKDSKSLDIESKKVRAKKNAGVALPSDWLPKDSHYRKGEELGFSKQQIDFFAERMRNWAGANAHRAVARKSNWDQAFHNWISDKAEKNANRVDSAGAASTSRPAQTGYDPILAGMGRIADRIAQRKLAEQSKNGIERIGFDSSGRDDFGSEGQASHPVLSGSGATVAKPNS